MAKVTYRIVKHEDGWAYKVGEVFSETFRSHHTVTDLYGAYEIRDLPPGSYTLRVWHEELDPGSDRPETTVEDDE